MRHAPAWVLFVCLAACPATPPPAAGQPCVGEAQAACDETAPRLLTCTASAWVVTVDCLGARGCVATSAEVSCDTTGNSAGAACAPSSEGRLRCDPDGGAAILRCEQGRLAVLERCTQGAWCGVVPDAGLACGY